MAIYYIDPENGSDGNDDGQSELYPARTMESRTIHYGMASYEQRDRLPIRSSFTHNLCLKAGEGFSKNGEMMPRHSEIWLKPMGHHIPCTLFRREIYRV